MNTKNSRISVTSIRQSSGNFPSDSKICKATLLNYNMDSTHILSLLEQLDDELDDLEDSLAPLLKAALSETTSKLPLLDKAKLYVLVTYAIESMLFC